MKCLYPQIKETVRHGSVFEFEHRCGQCLNCRILKRSQQATRLHLESLLYPGACVMATFTYDDEHKPPDGAVSKEELRKLRWRINTQWRSYWKKFPQIVQAHHRKNFHPRLRFFGVGEYGDESWRCHYHLVIYGLPRDLQYEDPKPAGRKKYQEICHRRKNVPVLFPGLEQFLLKAWQYRGHVQIEELDDGLSNYMTGYVTKKMTNYKDCEDMNLPEEFSAGSRGIGKAYAPLIADAMKRRKLYPAGYGELANGEDWIPIEWSSVIRANGKKRPLDSYMRQNIIHHLGMTPTDAERRRRQNFMRTLQNRHRNTVRFGSEAGVLIEIQEKNQQRMKARKWLRNAKSASKRKKI